MGDAACHQPLRTLNESIGLDQTGLAQKGGPVVSDVRISRSPIEGSNKASGGGADLLLGLDVLGAANPKNLAVADPGRTVAVLNTAAVPTAAMVTDTGVRFPALERNLASIRRTTRADELVAAREAWRRIRGSYPRLVAKAWRDALRRGRVLREEGAASESHEPSPRR